jgi:DNA-binding beta-propeller fold protein YncE
MRWIKGDTLRHADKGESDFSNTYLVYLSDSSGEFVLDDTAFPIQKNQGFVFSEGILHETMNTGSMPRLLLGPMNEFAQPVGTSVSLQSIYYYSSQSGAEAADVANASLILDDSLGVSSTYTVGNRDAVFNLITAIASGIDGTLFVAGNTIIRKILPNGVVSTLAGHKDIQGFEDGPGTQARFSEIRGIAVNPTTGILYVTDAANNSLRGIEPNGNVSTLTGDGSQVVSTLLEISIQNSYFYNPQGIIIDSSYNLIVADEANHCIRLVDFSTNSVKLIAGGGTNGYVDSSGSNALFHYPSDIAISPDGLYIYVSDTYNHRIRKIELSSGNVTTVAGDGTPASIDDFYPNSQHYSPKSIVISPDGSILVSDAGTDKIRLISDNVTLSRSYTIAGGGALPGGGNEWGLDGIGANASFFDLGRLTLDPSGNLIIADNYRIRKISADTVNTVSAGNVTTIEGLAGVGYKDTNVPLPTNNWKIASSSTGSSSQVVVWTAGQTLNSSGTYFLYPMPSGSVCFLEGTTVLCLLEGKEQYVPVEKLTKGTLVKTLRDGYKRLELIAKEEMSNPGTDERIEQRLYKCSTSRYPELTSDLYITGCHSILVDTITSDERAQLVKHLDRIFVTDKKYRLIACVDERAEPWNSEGTYTVWHFALEHENIKMNYGVFVNGGLLVESCSKHVLTNKSNMVLQ